MDVTVNAQSNALVRSRQLCPLFSTTGIEPPPPPSTRFQGSKYKLLDWIWGHIAELDFRTVLDAFGGSGCVSHYLKGKGKAVTYNDIMPWSCWCARAIVANDSVKVTEAEASMLVSPQNGRNYQDLIARQFCDIYFTQAENAWLDIVAQNLDLVQDVERRAIGYYALCQSAISKRPYNLFHRKNLYMRLAAVDRSFGNKATWDKPFEEHFAAFVREANMAVFPSSERCCVLNLDVLDVPGDYDLVYLDPPYINGKGIGVDYQSFYHFLDGLVAYPQWEAKIDHSSKHKRMLPAKTPWTNPKAILRAFGDVLEKFRRSCIVISYRSDGVPRLEDIVSLLRQFKPQVRMELLRGPYRYVLSTNRLSTEALIVGHD